MYKTGVITDEISQDFGTAAGLALKYKLDGLEIRSVNEKGPHELSKSDIKSIKDILDDTGLKVCGISAPFFKCDMDSPAEVKEHLEILKKCIELAHTLDAKIIRGFTFWRKGNFDERLQQIVEKFEAAIRILEPEHITLAVEFDPSVYATNARKLSRVVEAVNSPLVRALWDPGNDIYDPDGELPFPDGYNIIKPYMVHMHLKDAIRLPDGKAAAVPVGEGEVGYRAHLSQLLADRYEGYVVLETHYRPKHEIDEGLLALPKGSAFSYLGYEATEECLIKWRELSEGVKALD